MLLGTFVRIVWAVCLVLCLIAVWLAAVWHVPDCWMLGLIVGITVVGLPSLVVWGWWFRVWVCWLPVCWVFVALPVCGLLVVSRIACGLF